jgi:translocation and assembly module TamB
VAGVAISCGFLLISTDLGRNLLIPRLLPLVNEAIAGRVELRSFHLLPGGGLELRDARVFDPEGEVVLGVERARVYVDLTRLRSKTVGFRVELEGPDLLLQRDEQGQLSLARAFGPKHPKAKKTAAGPFDWTIRMPRLELRRGKVRYLDPDGAVALQVDAIDVDGRGIYGPHRAATELTLRAAMVAPEAAPIALEVAAGMRGSELRVRTLRAAVGGTSLDLVADVDTAAWRGRAAVLALAVDADQVGHLAPNAPLVGDLTGTLYAEADGKSADAALRLAHQGGGGAEAAAAVRLPPGALVAGADVHLSKLDLAQVLRGMPSTALTLDATARAAGADLASLRGNLALSLAPSRLRTGRLGPAEVRATADRGTLELSHLEAKLPGASVEGQGRWRQGGPIAGQATIDAPDLAALRKNLEALLAKPLPALEGGGRVEAQVAGTQAAPSVKVQVTAPRLAAGGAAVAGVSLAASLEGPLRAPVAQLDGTAARLVAGRLDARALRLRGHVEGRAGELSLTGAVPQLGPDALTVHGIASLTPDGETLAVSTLTLAWPEARFDLRQPAKVSLGGPAVDRLILAAAGSQRIELAGGVVRHGAARELDARAKVDLDLKSLPRALVPERLGLAGRVTADVAASGPVAAPDVAGKVTLAEGAAAGLASLAASADVRYTGRDGRARFEVSARRASGGGELEARGELPVAWARAPRTAPVEATLALRDLPLAEILQLTHTPTPAEIDGKGSLDLEVTGTVGAPKVTAAAALGEAHYDDLDGLALALRLEAGEKEGRLTGQLEHRGVRAVNLAARLPLDLGELLRSPGPAGKALAAAPLQATVEIPGFELAPIAGRAGVPSDARGTVTGKVDVAGSLRAPRGEADVQLAGATLAGYAGLSGKVSLAARERALAADVRVVMQGETLAHLAATLALPIERLGDAPSREKAALDARLDVPRVDLRRAEAPVPLTGEIAATAVAAGSLSALRLEAQVTGKRWVVGGHPLGDVTAAVRGAGQSMHAELHLAVTSGGTLDGSLDVQAEPSVGALRRGDLGRAPARASLLARDLDLGFLPAVVPGLVRSASGKMAAEISATGTLAHLVPRGTAALAGGALSVAEWGDWSGVSLQASLSDDVLRVDKLTARRGDGSLDFNAKVVGLARKGTPADLQAELRASKLPVPHAGELLATVDLQAKATGKVSAQALQADVTISSANVALPDKIPRKIQSLSRRPDVVVASFSAKKVSKVTAGRKKEKPFRASVHVMAPNRFSVTGKKPYVDVALTIDVTADVEGGQLGLSGQVQTLRGQAEPLGGKKFEIKRGRVEFTGGPYETGALEVQAVYDSAYKITVQIGGTIAKPEVKLTSEPPLEESQIALYLATGKTELKPGTGGVDPAAAAGNAAAGVVSSFFVNQVLSDKLPVDTVSLDSSQLRAGKYIGDKFYVGYTYHRDAKPEMGENINEFNFELQISRQWNFELRVGDSGSGGASLLWSKDY